MAGRFERESGIRPPTSNQASPLGCRSISLRGRQVSGPTFEPASKHASFIGELASSAYRCQPASQPAMAAP